MLGISKGFDYICNSVKVQAYTFSLFGISLKTVYKVLNLFLLVYAYGFYRISRYLVGTAFQSK